MKFLRHLKQIKQQTLFLLLLGLWGLPLQADQLYLEFFNFTFHVSETAITNGNEYPRKVDSKGWVIVMPGVELAYEFEADSDFLGIDGYKVMLGNYSDSRAQHSGYLQFGPRWHFQVNKQFLINIGIGPLLFFRKSWRAFDNYPGNAVLKEAFGYEYLFFAFGDIDIIYQLTEDFSLVWGIIPAIPYSIANTLGVVYRF